MALDGQGLAEPGTWILVVPQPPWGVTHQVGTEEAGRQVTAPQGNHTSQEVRDQTDKESQQPRFCENLPNGAPLSAVLGLPPTNWTTQRAEMPRSGWASMWDTPCILIIRQEVSFTTVVRDAFVPRLTATCSVSSGGRTFCTPPGSRCGGRWAPAGGSGLGTALASLPATAQGPRLGWRRSAGRRPSSAARWSQCWGAGIGSRPPGTSSSARAAAGRAPALPGAAPRKERRRPASSPGPRPAPAPSALPARRCAAVPPAKGGAGVQCARCPGPRLPEPGPACCRSARLGSRSGSTVPRHCCPVSQKIHYVSVGRGMDEEAVALIHDGIRLGRKKERKKAVCSTTDGPRDCHTERSTADGERQRSYGIACKWNRKQMNLFTKQK